jgi:hypothetical protein
MKAIPRYIDFDSGEREPDAYECMTGSVRHGVEFRNVECVGVRSGGTVYQLVIDDVTVFVHHALVLWPELPLEEGDICDIELDEQAAIRLRLV